MTGSGYQALTSKRAVEINNLTNQAQALEATIHNYELQAEALRHELDDVMNQLEAMRGQEQA